jgi:hypothetical protein
MQKRALDNPKITVLWDSVVEEAYGNERVSHRAVEGAVGGVVPAAVVVVDKRVHVVTNCRRSKAWATSAVPSRPIATTRRKRNHPPWLAA